MADYTKQTYVDDDGSGATGTVFTKARMDYLEEGVRVAGKQAVLVPAGSAGTPTDSNAVVWRRASDGALVAYHQVVETGATPNRGVTASERVQAEGTGTGLAIRTIEAVHRNTANDADIGSRLWVTAAKGSRREVRAAADPDGAGGAQGVLIIDDLGASTFHRAAQPRARMTRTVAAAFPTSGAGPTALTFNVESYDTDNMVDLATSATRFTCKTAGLYLFHADLQPSGAPGNYRIVFRVNGVATYYGSGLGPLAGFWEATNLSSQILLAVNDYVEVVGFGPAASFNYVLQSSAVRLSG